MHPCPPRLALLATLVLGALPLHAQTFADSLQAYVAAVRGFSTPNGDLTDLSRHNACRYEGGPRCAAGTHSAIFVDSLSKQLGLLIASDSTDATPSCQWSNPAGRRTGVVVHVGELRIRGETATVSVVRRCQADRGFMESASVELRRRNGAWEFVRLSQRRMT